MGREENGDLKANYIGIIGAILALISLVLPWWTVLVSSLGITVSVYLYHYQFSGLGTTIGVSTEQGWYMWAALVLVIVAGLLGLVGGIKYGKKSLLGGGALALLSTIIFAAGLQMQLSGEGDSFGLFSFGEGYSAYLSFGFWLALVAAIVMFTASRKKPIEAVAPSPLPPPPAMQ